MFCPPLDDVGCDEPLFCPSASSPSCSPELMEGVDIVDLPLLCPLDLPDVADVDCPLLCAFELDMGGIVTDVC